MRMGKSFAVRWFSTFLVYASEVLKWCFALCGWDEHFVSALTFFVVLGWGCISDCLMRCVTSVGTCLGFIPYPSSMGKQTGLTQKGIAPGYDGCCEKGHVGEILSRALTWHLSIYCFCFCWRAAESLRAWDRTWGRWLVIWTRRNCFHSWAFYCCWSVSCRWFSLRCRVLSNYFC